MDLPTPTEIGAWFAVLAGAIATGLGLRARKSRVDVGVKRDLVEGDGYERLVRERDAAVIDARQAWASRTKDAEAIARLTAQSLHDREEITRLRREFEQFKRLVIRNFPDSVRLFPESERGDLT